MAKKQTRRTVSLSEETYQRLLKAADRAGSPMSKALTELIEAKVLTQKQLKQPRSPESQANGSPEDKKRWVVNLDLFLTACSEEAASLRAQKLLGQAGTVLVVGVDSDEDMKKTKVT
jgi:predicted DNA-binding protein